MKLKVRVNRTKPESMTKQITSQLTGLIETGALAAGELLPSERTLADTLGVARNVVRRSYDYLTSGGHVESEGRKGRRIRAKSSSRKSGGAAKAASSSKTSKTGAKTAKKTGTKRSKAKAASVTVRVGTKKRR
ncbi:MAG TPA: winged helix-turn-helix domain-containing protein [Pyrinomonadaceae bacterium]|jgi:DNA-binding transcriptional regulator YhcF (GntR family)